MKRSREGALFVCAGLIATATGPVALPYPNWRQHAQRGLVPGAGGLQRRTRVAGGAAPETRGSDPAICPSKTFAM